MGGCARACEGVEDNVIWRTNRSKDSKNQFSIQYLPEGVIKKIESGLLEVIGKEENLPTLSFGENKTVGSEIPTLWLEKSFYSVKGTTLINDIFEKKQFLFLIFLR